MRQLQTIVSPVELSGIGIHTGTQIRMRLHPYDQGVILFRRLDLDGMEFQIDSCELGCQNSTILLNEGQRIHTIEHLLAALYAHEIDSVLVELDNEEIPILDGSALPLVEALDTAGKRPLSKTKKSMKIQKRLIVKEGDAYISLTPHDSFEVAYSIAFVHPLIGVQKLSLEIDLNSFDTDIAPARTFGFLKDVPELYAQNLAQGGSTSNALILDDNSVINGPLRFPDEFVRHKILDLIGDFSLLGYPLLARVEAFKAGHRLHLKGVRHILDHPGFWSLE